MKNIVLLFCVFCSISFYCNAQQSLPKPKQPPVKQTSKTSAPTSTKSKITLKFRTDYPCELSIDGKSKGKVDVGANNIKLVEIENKGKYVIVAKSIPHGVELSRDYTIEKSEDDIYDIFLADLVQSYLDDLEQQRQNNYQRELRAQKENQEVSLWQNTVQQNTVYSYRNYLYYTELGWYRSEANRKIEEFDNTAYYKAESISTIASYEEYIRQWPNGKNISLAQKKICEIKASHRWKELKSTEDSTIIRQYITDFSSCIQNRSEAENKIKEIKYKNAKFEGNKYFNSRNFSSALITYKQAQQYKDIDEIRLLIKNSQEELDYIAIQNKASIDNCEAYLKTYYNGKYQNEVTAKLCLLYFQTGNYYYKLKSKDRTNTNRNTARGYYEKISSKGCPQKAEVDKLLQTIDKKNRINDWNTGYKDKNYYSYIIETNNLSNYSTDFFQGISLFTLREHKWGFYFSYRASNSFYSNRKTLGDYPASDYAIVKQPKKSVSSISVSAGTTKKIFRPVFGYFGLGIGNNLLMQEYSITDLNSHTENTINIVNRNNMSWILSPEGGLIIDLWGASILAGIKYPIALNKIDNLYSYKGLSYMLGIGFGINNTVSDRLLRKRYDKSRKTKSFDQYKDDNKYDNVFHRNWWYLAFNFDLGYPNVNFSFSKEECLSNKSLIGFSWGSINHKKVGFYMSYRSNIFMFYSKKKLSDYIENGTLKDYVINNNLNRNSRTSLTLGITRKIQFPLWFYVGAGISYCSESMQLTLLPHYVNSGTYLTSEENIWARYPNSVMWELNPEIGITLNLWGVIFRAGINHPFPFKDKLKVNKFSPQFSFSIGGAWEKWR